MPPRKRPNSASSSAASKKSAKEQNQTPQPPPKYGIQHFFVRHSQRSGSLAESGNTRSDHEAPRPDVAGGDFGSDQNNTIVVVGDDESVAVVAEPPALVSSPSRSNCAEDTFLAGNVIGGESPIEVTPEISKSQPFKRFKISPGMLIKQSQDDVCNEVTWKISPVNERLKAVSKKMPEMIKVLAESSKLNSSYIRQCSLRKSAPDPIGNLETWLSSPTRSTVEQPLLCPSKMGVKRVNSCWDPGSKGRATELKHNCLASQQSPFRTPPSCQDKPVDRFEFNEASDERGSRQHKKAFLELLDQVEDAISVDVSGINMMGAPLTKDKDQECSNLSRETDQNEQAATDIVKSVDGLPVDQIFLVLEVDECSSADSQTANCPYKVLQLLNEKTGEQRIVCLFDEWIYCIVSPGDTVNVIGQFNEMGKCNVNRDNNFLVVHPYLLVSGTRVASSFGCPRRSVLDERLKSNDYSTAALIGTMLHQIFQAGLVKENLTRDFLEEYASIVLQRNFENLFACGANEKDIRDTLTEAIPKLILWINQFRDSQRSKAPGVHFGSDDATKKLKISEVIDIEEMSWAPNYGLKGMIDASIRVTVETETNKVMEKIMPLEFKSGKEPNGQSSMEHTAQVILYTLLMSERYLKPIDSGLLYYLQSNHTQGIAVRRSDLVGLIIRRNEIANDILKALTSQQLPPMLQSLTMCRGCRHLNVCTIYHKAHGGSAETSGLSNLFDACTEHLMASHFDFLKRWDRLIDLEAKDAELGKKEIWQSRSMRHNRLTSSLSSIVLDTTTELPNSKHYKDGRFHYRFVRQEFPLDKVNAYLEDNNNTSAVSSSSNDSACALRRGDLVILTTESDQQAIANGVISEISGSHISVSFSKHLRLPRRCPSEASDLTKEVWRIDKDEIMTSFAVMRFNLIQLFLDNAWSSRIRKMIVDLEAPRFDSGCIFSQDPAISYVWSEKNLNDDQRRAILKILTAKDYALILGMPGTGKTSTMVYAVKALLMRGATILLTSYTNSAIDNLLIKLKDQGIDFLRIGRDEAVHEEVREHCISATDVRSIDNIKERLEEVKVVAVTCLGIMNPLLTNKRFDICIMDEAGQTTLPVALGPLMLATTFILVGDHYQLPPLVKSMEAQENGLGISLFCRLSEVHPQAISALQSQYRMCQGITQLANALIYGDRLRCGSSDVANAKLKFPKFNPSKSWLKEVLAPDRPVLFLNTDMLPALEEKDNKTVNNPVEASIIAEVSEELVNHGITGDQIGIITPYNSQANLIQAAVTSAVEIHTIDKYQGRDKDCILVSFVRSSEKIKHRNNSILEDWHRINVAITRAKKKLIMVGSCRTLSKWPLLKLLIEKVDEQSGLLTLSMKDIGVVTTSTNASK